MGEGRGDVIMEKGPDWCRVPTFPNYSTNFSSANFFPLIANSASPPQRQVHDM